MRGDHPGKGTAAGEEGFKITFFTDPARIQHNDAGGIADRAEPMGDGNDGAAGGQAFEGLLDETFALIVECGGRLVEDQDRGIAEDGAGERQALALAPGEGCAALADQRVITRGQPENEVFGVGRRE